jgi:3-hydroxy-9,10-secoandrosta-1,3,5(10)-triene-9,17-dione monooxygenase
MIAWRRPLGHNAPVHRPALTGDTLAKSEPTKPPRDIPPPEPELTPSEIIRRAEAMRSLLRERQNACEVAGHVSEDTNAQFIKAGFYRILQPRIFGGYEFDLPTFLKVMIAISRGCSDSGWVLALTAGHAFLMSSFPEAGQREAFGDTGEFRAPSVAMPGGLAVPAPGGYQVKGAWDYTSGCDLATHFIGSCMIQHPDATIPDLGAFVVFDHDQYRIVDNWHVIGMQGTSSRRVVIEEMFVPAHRVLLVYDARGDYVHPRPGSLLHANPLYRGRITSLLVSEVCAVAVGIGRGALDVYDEILRAKKTSFAPFHARSQEVEYQRHFGEAQSLVDTAEAALLHLAADYTEHTRRDAEDGIPFTDEDDRRFLQIEQQCVRLCWEAVDLMFRTSGTSAAAKTAPLGRYFRNLAVIRTHITMQHDHTAGNAARLHFGVPPLSRL